MSILGAIAAPVPAGSVIPLSRTPSRLVSYAMIVLGVSLYVGNAAAKADDTPKITTRTDRRNTRKFLLKTFFLLPKLNHVHTNKRMNDNKRVSAKFSYSYS